MDCIPPWLSSNNHCHENMTTYNHARMEIGGMIKKRFYFLKEHSKPTEAEKMCKKPCRKMTNKISLISDQEKIDNERAEIRFRFQQTVKIEKKVVVYTWFNFIVDVGSSLGLWLGLSALGITDMAIEVFIVAKKWLK